MKTREELTALKEQVEALNNKLRELTGGEPAQIRGGDGEKPERTGAPSCGAKVFLLDPGI